MRPLIVLILTVFGTAAPLAQVPRNAPAAGGGSSDRIAEAYAQFLMAHRHEDDNKIDDAIAAYRRAMVLDPNAAEIVSDLADLYMRENKRPEAITAAEQALKIDPESREAHRILGTIYASTATMPARGRGGNPPASRDSDLAKGIFHLEQAVKGVTRSDPNLRAMLSQLYLADSNFDKAIPMLAELVKQEPGWQEGVGLLMEAYAAAGREAEWVKWLEEAAPEDPQLYARLGDYYSGEEKWKEAAQNYELALPAQPRSFDLRRRYASALLNAGTPVDVAKARVALQEALTLRPNDENTLFLLSQAERRAGALTDAERTARRIVTANPRSARGFVALSEVLEERQRYDLVIEALEPAVPAFRGAQGSAALNMLLPHLGFAYERVGQPEKAIATFEEARKLAPGDPIITSYLVQAQISGKKYPAALDTVRVIRKQHPQDLRLARLEAQALHESGKSDQGIAVLEEFVQKQGNDPRAHIALAQAYSEAQRGSRAVQVLQSAQTRFPSDSTMLTFELGAVYDKQKRHAEAEAAFRQVLAREPENAPALNYLGYMLAERGEKLDESVDLVKRALRIEPENGSYLDSLGWAYYKAGNFDLAHDNLKRAADQLMRNSVVQDHYGDVLSKLSRWDEAIAAWTRAIEGDGDAIDKSDIDRKIRSARQRLPRR
jgi:tetratricopeptide (TPR) repeat protein